MAKLKSTNGNGLKHLNGNGTSTHSLVIKRTTTLLKNGSVWSIYDLRMQLQRDLGIKLRSDYLAAELLGHPFIVDCKEKLVVYSKD